jgi:hypothetical protein
MRLALWQLLVFLERWLSGNKAQAPGTLSTVRPDRASLPRRPPSVQAGPPGPLTPSGVTLFEPAGLGLPCLGLGQEDDAVGRCTVYKLQLSCIGLRLLSLSPPVTCCPRTAEATRNGTPWGIAWAPELRKAGSVYAQRSRHGLEASRAPPPRGNPVFCPCRSRNSRRSHVIWIHFFLAAMAVGSLGGGAHR